MATPPPVRIQLLFLWLSVLAPSGAIILAETIRSQSSNHFQNLAEVKKGVTFSTKFSQFPVEASFVMNLDGNHCTERDDDHGDNDCHFDWGEYVLGNYTVQFSDQIEQGDFMEGNIKVP
jgi:hypothetical protein